MKYIKYIFAFLLFFFFISNINAKEKEVNIYLFYSEDCRHCAKEEAFLDDYKSKNSNVNVYTFELSNASNRQIWLDVQEIFNEPSGSVPYTVIGNQVLIGYSSENTDASIKKIVNYYENNNYRDLIGEYLGTVEVNENIVMEDIDITSDVITVGIFGQVNLKTISLFVLSIIMGIVDGFNPCAMWVLLFLITMLLGMKNRKKMWVLGITFLLTSALMYAGIMTAWLNLASFITKVNAIRIAIGLFAVVIATLNVLKYFKEKKDDGCEVIKDNKRKKIIDRIKSITLENKFALAIIGIIVLAITVNLVEFACSAGLPLMFTNILAINDLNTTQNVFYIFVYILFFLIDDIIIFVAAMLTLKINAVSTKYTKYSHLVGGIIMFIIGILLIFFPSILMLNI